MLQFNAIVTYFVAMTLIRALERAERVLQDTVATG